MAPNTSTNTNRNQRSTRPTLHEYTMIGNNTLRRHAATSAIGLALFFAFQQSRLDWDPEMRFWRSLGDTAFIFLWLALMIGPVVRWIPASKILLLWRRPIGIWFAIATTLHAYFVFDGWVRWSTSKFFGFEAIPGVPSLVNTEPGFGAANLSGLLALFITWTLLATSSDRAMKLLGPGAWNKLHTLAHAVFWLTVSHVFYFYFVHYELSLKALVFGRGIPDPNWAQFPFLVMVMSIIVFHVGAWAKTIHTKRKHT